MNEIGLFHPCISFKYEKKSSFPSKTDTKSTTHTASFKGRLQSMKKTSSEGSKNEVFSQKVITNKTYKLRVQRLEDKGHNFVNHKPTSSNTLNTLELPIIKMKSITSLNDI